MVDPDDLVPEWEDLLGRPGSPVVYFDQDKLCELIPKDLKYWVEHEIETLPGCFLVGRSKGKTWLALWALYQYLDNNPTAYCVRWCEQDYFANKEYLDDLAKIRIKMPYDDAVWLRHEEYSTEFNRLLNASFMVFDNYGYVNKPTWVEDVVSVNLLQYRVERRLPTIVVARLNNGQSLSQTMVLRKYRTVLV